MQNLTHLHVWGLGLTAGAVTFLERLCPVLDRAAQEVAFRWALPNLYTEVDCGPPPGRAAFSAEVRSGLGPGGITGMHSPAGIVVWAGTLDGSDGFRDMGMRLSHEVFEAMVNPMGQAKFGPYAAEVVDPVSVTPWVQRDGTHLSNFVYPSYFGWNALEEVMNRRGPGGVGENHSWPYDEARVLTQPGHPEPGAYQVVNGQVVAGPPRRLPYDDTGWQPK